MNDERLFHDVLLFVSQGYFGQYGQTATVPFSVRRVVNYRDIVIPRGHLLFWKRFFEAFSRFCIKYVHFGYPRVIGKDGNHTVGGPLTMDGTPRCPVGGNGLERLGKNGFLPCRAVDGHVSRGRYLPPVVLFLDDFNFASGGGPGGRVTE